MRIEGIPLNPKNRKIRVFADGMISAQLVINEDGVEIHDTQLEQSLSVIERLGQATEYPLWPIAVAFRLGFRYAVDRLAYDRGLYEDLKTEAYEGSTVNEPEVDKQRKKRRRKGS